MIALEIVTPDRKVLSLDVDEVVLPSVQGSMGVLEGHAPTLCELDVGEVSYRIGQTRKYMATSGGFAEVLRHRVTVLARTTEAAEDIDLERAQKAKVDAEKELQSDTSAHRFRRAEVRLKRAVNRIKVHERR